MPTVPQGIFKAYDIRGIYPQDLNESLAYQIGRAFVVWLEKKLPSTGQPLTLVVGRDGRTSGPSLSAAIKQGILDQGANIIDVGILASEQFYFACALFRMPGVTVTASHNPKEYNGMKFIREIPFFLSGQEGIQDIKGFIEGGELPNVSTTGSVRVEDIRALYSEKILSIVTPKEISPLTVVIDTANGVGGPMIQEVAAKLSIHLTHLFPEVDGAFPNHPADPLRPENRIALERAVVGQGAQAGFAFDGDADRCFVLDEKGKVVPNEFLGALIARDLLADSPGATFLYDVRSSWAFRQAVEAAGGKATMSRVGHTNIKSQMMQEGALYGMEISGHHYFKDFYWCDSGMLPMLYTLKMMSRAQKPLSELVKEFRAKYFMSGEINFTVKDAPKIMERLKEHFKDAPKKYELDGVSFEYPDWHFNVRSSNTEPLLRLNLESIVSKEHMEEKKKEMETLIKQDQRDQ